MKILTLFAALLTLAGCSLFDAREGKALKPSMHRNPVNITVGIEKDFSRFGDNVGGYAACSGDYCYLALPEVKTTNDAYILCTWGVMLWVAVYGNPNNDDKIDICNGR